MSMTFWSQYDPVSQPRGNTDHWSKMKLKVNTYPVQDGDVMSSWVSPTSNYNTGSRRLDKSFDDLLLSSFQGNVPGDSHMKSNISLPPISLRNSYHDRAKDGFRYWLIERPKPTTYGRYGLGSFKTVLGVGNAPRT